MTFNLNANTEDLTPFRVGSRREIVTLLHNIKEHKQVVSMTFNNESESIVTSILQIDEASDSLVIDCALSAMQNRRVLGSDRIAFETKLDRIRIIFFADRIESCLFDGSPAFAMSLPTSLVRLQRREYYRMVTPRCTMDIICNSSNSAVTITVPVQNVSAGGVAILDDRNMLNDTSGAIYNGCRISLPGGPSIVATLEVRNSQAISLANGKSVRRLGCLFVDIPKSMLTLVQRYVTQLEREQNTKSAGLA